MGGSSAAGLPFLRPHPRMRRPQRSPRCHASFQCREKGLLGRGVDFPRIFALCFSASGAENIVSGNDEAAQLPLVRIIRRINHKLPMIPGAFAHRPHSGRAIQFQMNQPPVSRRHRIESKRLPSLTHALRRHSRRQFQFFEPRRSIVPAIEPHVIVQPRIEPQPAMPHMLERQQQFGVVFKQQSFIRTAKRHHHVPRLRIAITLRARAARRNLVFEFQPHPAHAHIQITIQLFHRARTVKVRFLARLLFHRRPFPGRTSPFDHSFFFLNLLLDGSGSVRFR